MQLLILILLAFASYTSCTVAYSPVWVTSQYLKAGSFNIISVLTGNSSTPKITLPFSGSPFSSVPNLGYGSTAYQGDDYLGEQFYQINRTALTSSSFSVLVKILGATNIHLLTVRYIAIDINFPHRLISFDNVPVNYSSGPLTLYSVRYQSVKSYKNTINFTQQAGNSSYNKFSYPLQNNKIVLFMTSLFIDGITQRNTSYNTPISIQIYYKIKTYDSYQLIVNFGINTIMTRLHFSMVIFDQADVQKSGLYQLVYRRINIANTGGFIAIPKQFNNNFMIGLTNFTTPRTSSIIHYSWNFTTINNIDGICMAKAISYIADALTVNLLSFSYIYLKTWICPNYTYFNIYTDLCTTCPLENCLNCYNISACDVCDVWNGYYLNATILICQKCMDGCSNCSLFYNNTYNNNTYNNIYNNSIYNSIYNNSIDDGNICYQCKTQLGYILTQNNTCYKCPSQFNYFINVTSLQCQLCTIQGCYQCYNLTVCVQCDISQYYLPSNNYYNNNNNNTNNNNTENSNTYNNTNNNNNNIQQQQCIYCNISQNYLINPITLQCQLCILQNCKQCKTLNQCNICDIQNMYYLNQTTLQCQLCIIQNCIICYNLNICLLCHYGYIYDNQTNVCVGQYKYGGIQWEVLELYKDGCNLFVLIINITNIAKEFSSKVQENIVFITNNIHIQHIEHIYQHIYTLHCTYFQQLTSNPILLSIFSTQLQIASHLFTPLLYYPQQTCNNKQQIDTLIYIIQIISYILLIISLISCKIIGLQLFTMLQFAYYTVTLYQYMPLHLEGFSQFSVFNGFNINIMSNNIIFAQYSNNNNKSILPQSYIYIGINQYFINNCNVMYLLMYVILIFGIFIYMISKYKIYKNGMKIGLRLIKQGFMCFLVFNCYNISFSTVTQFKYSQHFNLLYYIGILLIVVSLISIIVSLISIQLSHPQSYGQLKQKFKSSYINKLYIPLTFCYKFFISIIISIFEQQIISILIMLFILISFTLYILINLPFKQTYHNYRTIIIHLSQIIIISVCNYYNEINRNIPINIKGYFHIPAFILIIAIVCSVVFSALLLIYQVYKDIDGCRRNRKVMADGKCNQSTKVIDPTLATLE